MPGLLTDTDVLIDYLRGTTEAIAYVEKNRSGFFISAMSVGELYAGVREGKERDALEVFLREFEVIPVNFQIAWRGGIFCRDYRKSHGVGLADALIAATAEVNQLTLVTMNQKHFPMLANLVVPYQKP